MLAARSGGVANCPHLLRSAALFRPSRRVWCSWRLPSVLCHAAIPISLPSDSELVEVLRTVFPDPVYAFSRLVAEIGSIKIAAQEKHELHVIAVSGFEVGDLD